MVYMVRNDTLTDAVRSALAAWPVSRRDLAARSGIPNTTLVKIASGQLGASEDVARRVLRALEGWREEQREAAKNVVDASRQIRRELGRARKRNEAQRE